MYEYQKRANTTNYIKLDKNNYIPQKLQRFRDIYINQSPTFYNQYRYDLDSNQIPNMHQVQYVYKQKRPFEYYSDDRYENFNNSLKNVKPTNDCFFNEFNYIKKNPEKERSFVQRSVNNMTNPNSGKINKIIYLEKNKRITNNSQDNKNKNVLRFTRPFGQNSFNEGFKENKIYIKNPKLNSNNKEKNINTDKNRNTVNSIAQKICNIVIQGETKKDKSKKNKNKIENNSENKIVNQRIEINKIQPKNLNLNDINNNDENYNRDENYSNDNEEIEEKEGNEGNKNENYFLGKDSNEEYEEEENIDIEDNDYYDNNGKDKITKEKDEQYQIESIEQYEQNDGEEGENDEEEENNDDGNNNRDGYQKSEEGEQIEEIKKDSENKIKKNIYYEIQRKNGIKLTPLNKRIKNEQLNIINDDNFEIHGEKKPRILVINSESNIELIKQEYKPSLEVQKIQNYEQPRDFQRRSNKKRQLIIAKNEENNVDIIHQNNQTKINYQIENVQNFKQQRTKQRNSEKKRNKIKKYKISKLKDANLLLGKTELIEPILKIEKVNDFYNLKESKSPKRNKIIKEYEIDKIEDSNLCLKKIVLEPLIEIQKVNDYFQKRNRERKIPTRKRRYILKIAQQKNCNIEIKKNPSIAIYKLENIVIKSKYIKKKKKTDYKKLKKSKRNTYHYQGIKSKPDEISIQKETRFIFKGKTKRPFKKPRNSIIKEITYFYANPLKNEKTELFIGGKIQNTINPTIKIDLEDKKNKKISLNNSFKEKREIEIKHIIGVPPKKEEKIKEYNSNTYPTNSNKNGKPEIKISQMINNEKDIENINDIENKNDIISISQIKVDKKNISKAYISPRRLRKSVEGQKEDNKNNNNNRSGLNNINEFDLKKEEKTETDYSQVNNNVYYSSSFKQPKKEKNKRLENNTLFISARSSSSSQKNKNNDSKSDTKNNMNKILVNSSNNTPITLRNFESLRIKTDSNNLNKISLASEIKKAKIEKEKKEEKKSETEKEQDSDNIKVNDEPLSMTYAKNKETTISNFNFLDEYNNINTQELSEYTKAYLTSYMSTARPELSDFSKQFLSSNETNFSTTKPELSNITRAYLFSQNTSNEEK